MLTDIFRVIVYLGSFVIVIILAFFFTKYMAKKSSSLNRSKNIKIIETLFLGNNTRVFLLEIFDAIYIIYDNNSHMQLLDKINKHDVNIQQIHIGNEGNEINSIIEKVLKRKTNITNKLTNKRND